MDQVASLLQQAPLDRPTVHMLCRVLEDGWALIRPDFDGSRAEKVGRMNLADGILALAEAGHRDPEVLKMYAVTRVRNLRGPSTRCASTLESAGLKERQRSHTHNATKDELEMSVPMPLPRHLRAQSAAQASS